MDFEDIQRVDRRTWDRYLFYTDLVIFTIFSLSLILLVRHTFLAGQDYNAGDLSSANRALWLVVGDTVFLVGSLAWIVYRFFRNQYIVLTRRY